MELPIIIAVESVKATLPGNRFMESKYDGKDFFERLNISNKLVEKISRYLIINGFIVRMSDDEKPFLFPDGAEIRGLDIFCAKDGTPIFIDAKDWPKLIYHDATGIPIRIYERYKTIQDKFGIKVMIFFVDNEKFENNETKPQQSMFKKGSKFIPYGGFMDDFELYYRQDIPHVSVTKAGERYKEKQMIWIYSKMKPITEIFANTS